MYQKTTLDNGLRLVTSTMPHTLSVCLGIFVGAGSRYEDDPRAGISHFVEHLFFKGTTRLPTSKEISETIEGVGGILNGGTDKELTVYWCKVARPHFRLALDLLVDMLRNSKFEPKDVERERSVILEELRMTLDSPRQRVDMLIDEVVWPNQPLGRDVAGTPETVKSLSRQAMLDYKARQYTAENMVVSVAGNISHEEILAAVQEALGAWERGEPLPWFEVVNGQEAPRLRLETRKTEQAHVCLALRGLPSQHPDRYALDLLSVILGEGMSSRLFLEVRERLGLAYDVHSYITHFKDSGSIIIYAGVDPKRIEAALEAILQQLDRLKEEAPEGELTKAKEMTKGRLALRMEDTRSVSGWLGAQELLLGRIKTVDEIVAIVEALNQEDLRRVARSLFLTEQLNLAVVGPLRSERRFLDLLKL